MRIYVFILLCCLLELNLLILDRIINSFGKLKGEIFRLFNVSSVLVRFLK